ncbi:hypothetical protein, partial [Zooshikella harenae]
MLSTLSQPKENKNSDFDQDGMPDQFEIKYGLNIYQNDANDDADNDGLTNLEEYKQGLDPTIDENASLELNNKIKALSPIRHFVADDIVGSSVPDRSDHKKDASLVSISGQQVSNSGLSTSDVPKVASKSFDLNGSHYLAIGPVEAEMV